MTATAATVSVETVELRRVAPVSLVDNPLNPRRDVVGQGPAAQERFDELVRSIEAVGVLEPVLAFERDVTDGTLGRELVLLAGHRRKAGAVKAGVDVDVIVRVEPSAAEQLLMMVIENGHRNDLAPIEEARAYVQLLEQGVTQKDIADRCGRSEGHVSKRLAIVQKLPQPLLDRLDAGDLSVEIAYQLSRIADNTKLVDKLTKQPQLDERWILADVNRELARRADADAVIAAKDKLKKDKVTVVDAKRLVGSKATAAVLVGNAKPSFDMYERPLWIAVTVDDHVGEACHAAAVTPKGKVVWVCDAPGGHKKVKKSRFDSYGGGPQFPRTVADFNVVARDQTKPKEVDPEVVAAYDAARVRAVERRDAIREVFARSKAGTAPAELADVLALAMTSPRTQPLDVDEDIAVYVLGFADFADGARRKALDTMFAKDRVRLGAALAVSTFEDRIFNAFGDVPITSAEYSLPSWWDARSWTSTHWVHAKAAKAYLDWVATHAGVKPGPLEKTWLADVVEHDK